MFVLEIAFFFAPALIVWPYVRQARLMSSFERADRVKLGVYRYQLDAAETADDFYAAHGYWPGFIDPEKRRDRY